MIIRKSQQKDVSAIHSLIQNELGYNKITQAEFEKQFLRIEKESGYTILVATENEKVVGFIGLMLCVPLEITGSYYRVIGLAVEYESQGKKIGKSLINAAIRLAENNGVTDLVLSSGLSRKDAHQFYENKGFHKKGITYIKEI